MRETEETEPAPKQSLNAAGDKTGTKRFGRNLVSLWVVEIVLVISGFVTPRLIHDSLGQTQLGIWDLGWAIVSYFRIFGEGMTGGLSRYVAVFQASGEREKLGRYVSSAIGLQVFIGLIILFCSLATAYLAPKLVLELDPPLIDAVQWVVVFLGGTLAVRTFANPSRSLLTGQHMWTVNSAVQVGGDIGALIAMVLVLILDGGLRELAIAYFLVTVGTEFARMTVARRIYGRPLLSKTEFGFSEIKSLVGFAIKANIGTLPHIIVLQTINIILASTSGPAALAIYARSLALQRHSSVLIMSFSKLLMSTAGSLQGLGQESIYKSFYLRSMRASFAMTLPLYIVLASLGDFLLFVWMGDEYIQPGLLAIVCFGALMPTTSITTYLILQGLNRHGRPGIFSFAITSMLLSSSLAFVYLMRIEWTITVAATLVAFCLTFGSAIPVQVLACRMFSVTAREAVEAVFARPILANIPVAAVLFGGLKLIDRFSLLQVASLFVIAFCVFLLSYWYIVLTQVEKAQLSARVRPGVVSKK